MADLLPPVVAKLAANITDFKKGMKDAKGEMAGVEKAGGKSFSTLATGIAAGAAAGGLALAGFAAKSVGTFEAVAGEVAKLSRITGGSAESMSALRFEAQQTGVPFETLSKSLVKVSKAAATNNKVFAEHGIATRDASGKLLSMNDILANSADVFKNMPNGIEKNALAVQLFGKAGVDMIPMLNKGADGLAELAKKADQFGLVLGDKDIDAMKKNKAAHRDMSAAWQGLQVQLGKYLMPIVAKVTGFFAANMPKAMAIVKQAMAALAPVFTKVADVIGDTFAVLQTGIEWIVKHKEVMIGLAVVVGGALVAAFVSWAAAAGAAALATAAAAAPFIAVGAAIAALVAGILWAYKHWTWFHTAVQAVWEAIKVVFKVAVAVVVAYVKGLITAVKAVWEFWSHIGENVSAAWAAVKRLVAQGIIDVVNFFLGLPQRAKSALSSLASTLKTVAVTALTFLWTGVTNGITAGWHWVADLPGKFIGALGSWAGKLKTLGHDAITAMWDGIKAAWNWLADKTTFTLPQITIPNPFGSDTHIGGGTVSLLPHLVMGGRITESGLAVVGERGREVVSLPKGATVFPNGSPQERGTGAGATYVFNSYGITDHSALARHQAAEMAWAMKTAVAI